MKRSTYLLGVRWLSLPGALIASGCASTPRPAVLDEAHNALQSPETRELVALRPAMVEAAQGYGLAAEQAFDKGDVNQARRFAELVLQRVHAAENFVARDAATEQAKIMAARLANQDKEVDRDRKEFTPPERVAVGVEAVVDLEKPRKNAYRALRAAIAAKGNAIGQNAEMTSPAAFAEGRALLDSAEKRFERGDYDSAFALANSATIAFARAGNEKDGSTALPTSVAAARENVPIEAGQSVATPRLSMYSIARKLIREAEDAKADAIARGAQGSTATAHGTYLLELAEKALAEGSHERAMDFAKDARKSFGLAMAPQSTTPTGSVAKPSALNPSPATTVIAAESPVAKATHSADRDAAIVAIVAAQQALADATGRDHPEAKKKKAQSLISIAEGWLDRNGFVQAKSFAESAQKELIPEASSTLSTPPRPAVTEQPIEKKPKERPIEEKVVVVQPIAIERVVSEPVVEKTVVVLPTAPRPTVADEPRRDWQEPYRKTIEALTLRDKAKGLATTPATKAAFATGMQKLADGEAAWKRRDFLAAQEMADSAIAIFSTITSPTTTTTVTSEPKPVVPTSSGEANAQRDSESYRTVEALVREATILVEVCEYEKCAERNVSLFASGKAETTSARVALEAARYEIATELATEAKKKLQRALDTPKATIAAPAVDTEAQKKRRIDAEDAIREANVQAQLCEQKKCTGKDIESWIRAESLMGSARAAFADAEFDRAKMKAQDATNILKAAFAAQAALPPPKIEPRIEIPPDVTNVVARGKMLIVTPAFDFTSASATLTTASGPSVDAIAKVLLHNKDRIRSISVVGFTDNRGALSLNESISQQRAKVIADKLIAAGVSAALVTSSGRGPENPIADNATAEGRRANRRVEIRVEFMDGGK